MEAEKDDQLINVGSKHRLQPGSGRALEQFEGSAHDHCQTVVCEANNERALAQNDTTEYEIQTRKLSL